MANLPGRLHVEITKVTDYLLAIDHPIGKAKAGFFSGLGFTRDRPDELVRALIDLVDRAETHAAVSAAFGTKFVIEGMIRGRFVRTIWMLKTQDPVVRLVSAYPIRRRK